MTSEKDKFIKENVSMKFLVIALVISMGGVAILYITASLLQNPTWQAVFRTIGSLFFITGPISILWELRGKRIFLDEILSKANVSIEIKKAGILKVTDSFISDIDWVYLINNVTKLDIFFAYGRTWRNSYDRELRNAVKRRGVRIRIVLPDPSDEQTTRELSKRFDYSDDKLKDLISEAIRYFESLKTIADENGAKVSIWLLPSAPQFSFYRFDNKAIIALYSHRRERTGVPTFVCESGGTLYEYIRNEFQAMVRDDGLGKSV